MPLVDLLVVTDDFALPFGKLRFREGGTPRRAQRAAVDHRRARHRKVQPATGRHRRPGEGRHRPRAVDVRASTSARGCRSCSTPSADAVEAWARDGHLEGGQPVQQLRAPGARRRRTPTRDGPKAGEVGGPADGKGIRRTKTGWRRILPARRRGRRRRGASGDERPIPRPDDPPAERRREGRPRVGGAARGHGGTEQELDLEKASVDAEVELLDPAAGERSEGGGDAQPARPKRPAAARPADRAGSSSRGAGRRVPDLAALPRLLHDTGSFASAARAARRRPRGARDARQARRADVGARTAPSRTSPRPSRSRPTRSGSAGSRATPRSATGSRRSWARGSATRRSSPSWSRGPSLAYERSELVPDETAARVAALAAWRSGRGEGPRRQRPGAGPGDARAGRPARRASATLEAGAADRPGRAPAPSCSSAATRPCSRSPAGASSRAAAASSTCSRRRRRCRSGSSSSATRSTRCAPSTRPTSAASARSARSSSCPRRSSCCRPAARTRSAARLGRLRGAPPGAPRAGPRAVRGRRPATGAEGRRGSRPRRRRRRRGLGAPRRAARPASTTSTRRPSSSSTSRATSPRPPSSCGARPTSGTRSSSRRATCRRTGRPPTCRRATGRARLHGARTLELTWQSEAGAAEGMAFASKSLTSGDLFGWREPVLPPGRTERLVDGVEHWVGEQARRRPRQRPGAAARGAAGRGRPRRRHRASRDRGAAARRDRPHRAQPQRRLRGRPRRPRARHGPRAVRHRPRPPAEGDAPGRPARHPRAAVARRPRRPHRPRHRPLRADAPARRARARSATTSSCRSRPATGSSSRSSRSTASRATRAASTRRSSRLGGTDWLRTKQRVRKAVDDLAEELLALYAKREAAQGFAYAPDSPWQAEMEASFPYEETPDQLRAADEVKVDMETRRPMDRLVVGDVGYGKTEVALRAAFKATQDGKQVAVLVPTTVLAGQHFADVQPAVRGVPADRAAAVAVRVARRSRRRRSRGSPTGRSTSSSARTGCCRRTSRSRTSAWSWSTRSSGSASRRRSG